MNISELWQLLSENKLLLTLASAVAGAIATKLIPAMWGGATKFVKFCGSRFSRKLSAATLRERYLDWVVTEHRELKLTGIVSTDDAKKPNLEQVFVSLHVGKQTSPPPKNAPHDAGHLLQGINDWFDVREILEMHGTDCPADMLAECKARIKHLPRAPILDIDQILRLEIRQWLNLHRLKLKDNVLSNFQLRNVIRACPRIAILGVPGAGKTTLLQYLALTYARAGAGDPKLRDEQILKSRLGKQQWHLPIFIRLSTLAGLLAKANEDGESGSIVDAVPLLLPPDLQQHPSAEWFFKRELQRGRCLLLMDGLDEVPTEEDFQRVTAAIQSLVITYSRNQFVLSSRVAGWRGGVNADFDVFHVNELTDAQVDLFIDTWYWAVDKNAVVGSLHDESDAEKRARERRTAQRAAELKVTLHENAGLRLLAANPMLLSIIALVHRSLATLPRERSKLYAQCSRILLEQWDISRGVHVDDTRLKLEQKESIIRRVAIAFHTGEIGSSGGGREAPASDVIRIIAELLPTMGHDAAEAERLLRIMIERSGMIVERQRGILAFAHLTFQEYFAAQYLAHGELEQHRIFLLNPERLWADWWREVVLLYAGQIADASAFVASIYESALPDQFLQSLRLAALCVNESIGLNNIDLRGRVLSDLLFVRAGIRPQSNVSVRPEIGAYLLNWARGAGWAVRTGMAVINEAAAEQQAALGQDTTPSLQASDSERILTLTPTTLHSRLREQTSESSLLYAGLAPSQDAVDIIASDDTAPPHSTLSSPMDKSVQYMHAIFNSPYSPWDEENEFVRLVEEARRSEHVRKLAIDAARTASDAIVVRARATIALSILDEGFTFRSEQSMEDLLVYCSSQRRVWDVLNQYAKHHSEEIIRYAETLITGALRDAPPTSGIAQRVLEMVGGISHDRVKKDDLIVSALRYRARSDDPVGDDAVSTAVVLTGRDYSIGIRSAALNLLSSRCAAQYLAKTRTVMLRFAKARQIEMRMAALRALSDAVDASPPDSDVVDAFYQNLRRREVDVRIAALHGLRKVGANGRTARAYERVLQIVEDLAQAEDTSHPTLLELTEAAPLVADWSSDLEADNAFDITWSAALKAAKIVWSSMDDTRFPADEAGIDLIAQCLATLHRKGDRHHAMPSITVGLLADSPSARRFAVKLLSHIVDNEELKACVTEFLLRSMDDKNASVRFRAIDGARRMPPGLRIPSIGTHLLSRLEDEATEVRELAWESLVDGYPQYLYRTSQ